MKHFGGAQSGRGQTGRPHRRLVRARHEFAARRHWMGVVSSKLRVNVKKELGCKELDSFYEVIVTQEDTPKPFSDPLILAVSQLGVSADNCVYIGDQPSNISERIKQQKCKV